MIQIFHFFPYLQFSTRQHLPGVGTGMLLESTISLLKPVYSASTKHECTHTTSHPQVLGNYCLTSLPEVLEKPDLCHWFITTLST